MLHLKNNWYKFIPDVFTFFLYIFCFDLLLNWQLQHPALSCTILMVLNIAAVGLGCFTFFSLYADNTQLLQYKNLLTPFEGAVIGLSAFITALGFFWWLVPFTAVKTMGVKETGFIIGGGIYFVVFISVVAKSITNTKGLQMTGSKTLKITNSFLTSIFFFFSYVFLVMTLQHWHPSFIGARLLAILCLCVFYLPLRFFLLLRPPFHKLEYLTFILSFAFMLYKLFGYV